MASIKSRIFLLLTKMPVMRFFSCNYVLYRNIKYKIPILFVHKNIIFSDW